MCLVHLGRQLTRLHLDHNNFSIGQSCVFDAFVCASLRTLCLPPGPFFSLRPFAPDLCMAASAFAALVCRLTALTNMRPLAPIVVVQLQNRRTLKPTPRGKSHAPLRYKILVWVVGISPERNSAVLRSILGTVSVVFDILEFAEQRVGLGAQLNHTVLPSA